jgi:hypothetical protein
LLAAGIGALIIGASLRPLRRVAATASRVAELPQDFAAAVTSENFQEIASRGPAGTRALYEVVRSVQSKEE